MSNLGLYSWYKWLWGWLSLKAQLFGPDLTLVIVARFAEGRLRVVGWIPHTVPSLCGRGGEAGVLTASAVSESLVSCSGRLKDGIPLLAILPRFLT